MDNISVISSFDIFIVSELEKDKHSFLAITLLSFRMQVYYIIQCLAIAVMSTFHN